MGRLLGKATVTADGNVLLSNLDCEFTLAGEKREAQMGDNGMNGFTGEPVSGEVKLSVSIDDNIDLQALANQTDVTVMVKGDAGGVWSFPHAVQLMPINPKAKKGGQLSLQYASATSVKVGGS